MQVLILYYSKGGNTKKLAQEIAKGVESVGAKSLLKDTETVIKEDFVDAAGIIAGSPVYFGGMAAELKAVFDKFVSTRKKMENKVGAAFTTSGHVTGGKETTMMSIIHAMLIYGMIIVGDPMNASGHYGVACAGASGAAGAGAPDKTALDDGFKMGVRVAELCKRLGK